MQRIIARARSGWSHIHNDCDAHIVSACYAKCFGVNFAKEIQRSSPQRHERAARRLRDKAPPTVYEEVYDTLDIRYGEPPLDAIRYRKRIVETFFSRFADAVRVRGIPNGDWRKHDVVVVYFAVTP